MELQRYRGANFKTQTWRYKSLIFLWAKSLSPSLLRHKTGRFWERFMEPSQIPAWFHSKHFCPPTQNQLHDLEDKNLHCWTRNRDKSSFRRGWWEVKSRSQVFLHLSCLGLGMRFELGECRDICVWTKRLKCVECKQCNVHICVCLHVKTWPVNCELKRKKFLTKALVSSSSL